jgi:glutamate synthase (NADPH/NADH) small chain
VLDEQFFLLRSLGVEIQTDVVFGRTMMIDELFMRGYSALLLAVGAGLPVFSDLAGSSLGGVYYDTEFLYRLQIMNKEDALIVARRQGIATLKTVVVGRGPAAFDAARLGLRLGSEVKVVFEGPKQQLGVGDDILEQSREEGIELVQAQVLEIVGDDAGFVKGVKCREPDGQTVVLEAQTVIIANGHRPNNFLKQVLPQLKWDKDGSLWADAQTGMTSMEKVFCAGSVVTAGPVEGGAGSVEGGAGSSVVEAIAGGKAAAQKITQYLSQTS